MAVRTTSREIRPVARRAREVSFPVLLAIVVVILGALLASIWLVGPRAVGLLGPPGPHLPVPEITLAATNLTGSPVNRSAAGCPSDLGDQMTCRILVVESVAQPGRANTSMISTAFLKFPSLPSLPVNVTLVGNCSAIPNWNATRSVGCDESIALLSSGAGWVPCTEGTCGGQSVVDAPLFPQMVSARQALVLQIPSSDLGATIVVDIGPMSVTFPAAAPGETPT
jgi:hypothetical protein